MKRNPTAFKALTGSSLLIVVLVAAWIHADEPRQKTTKQKAVIRSDDIGVRTEIHGKLGLPLGRITTIQGRCIRPENTKENADRSAFSIERVDGVALERPVELVLEPFGPSTDNPLKVGRSYELRGYEHGQFHGVPNDAYKEYVRSGKGSFATVMGYSFRTEFVLVSAKQRRE